MKEIVPSARHLREGGSPHSSPTVPGEVRISYDPDLVEEAVFQEVYRREKEGDRKVYGLYRGAIDPLYELPEEDRTAAFSAVHEEFFRFLELDRPLEETLAKYPELCSKACRVLVMKAMRAPDEGADLDPDSHRVGVRLRPVRFAHLDQLRGFLRHELQHVADLLSEDFGYTYRSRLDLPTRAQEELVRQRYGVLWDISVDARITRSGRQSLADGRVRYGEFRALFPGIPDDVLESAFASLWDQPDRCHRELLQVATDPVLLLGRGNASMPDGLLGGFPRTPVRAGALCPLCRFPTYSWHADPVALGPALLGLIRQENAGWSEEEGLCRRCAEGYEARWEGERSGRTGKVSR